MQGLTSGVRRSRNRAVVHMIHDVSVTRAVALLNRAGEDLHEWRNTQGQGFARYANRAPRA